MSQIHQHRPLSPHLSIYRWQITNTLSILHRLTGVGLTLGILPLAAWLWGVAYEPDLFDWLVAAFSTILGKLFLFGWTLAFYYHLANGIRHLNWDLGRGLAIDEVISSGQVVVVFALALTIFTWAYAAHTLGIFHA